MSIANHARRAFLRRAGTAVAAVGVAGRSVAEAAVKEQMQITGTMVSGIEMGAPGAIGAEGPEAMRLLAVIKTVGGLPDFKRDEMRLIARERRILDPDIACLRSMSLGAKLRLQAERNYRLLERDSMANLSRKVKRHLFAKVHNISEWW